MALPEKRRCGVAPRRFGIAGFCCFVLPCFAAGCHTFGFKIATAALRPRNDTKMVGFAIKPTIFISEMFEIRLAEAPCFATRCHAFGLKIATAALRPRNDTKLGRLYLGNRRFCFMRSFRAETLRTVFQTFRSENRLPGGCSCPESAAGRNKSAVRKKIRSRGSGRSQPIYWIF